MHLSSLRVYPIKSCGGIQVDAWEVDSFGFRYDRRWMIVTPSGQFVTQRECPALARVRPLIAPPHLKLSAPGMPDLVIALDPQGGRPIAVRVWGDRVIAEAPDFRADHWVSDVVGQECLLAHFPENTVRPLDSDYATRGGQTAFADGFPFLMVGEASLADLNHRLDSPVPMDRFRPNLVVAGSPAFAEDDWRAIRVGEIPMEVVKPCARCVVTTVDQASGRRAGDEPLRTLATFRQANGQVRFGQNVVHYGTGLLRQGDPVALLP